MQEFGSIISSMLIISYNAEFNTEHKHRTKLQYQAQVNLINPLLPKLTQYNR